MNTHPSSASTNGPAPVCRRFRVTGHVQGVYFRASTQTVARDLGLGGHAINLDDGSVEVLASGERDAVQRLELWLHDGPTMARVDAVRAEDVAYRELERFTMD